MRNYDQPLVGVAVAIRRDNKVLMHLRQGVMEPQVWAFSGGHLEKYESFEDCALRETAEECGPQLIISRPKLWTIQNTIFRSERKHYVLVAMVSDWISGEALVMEPNKCAAWEWFYWKNIPLNVMKGIAQIRDAGLNPFRVGVGDVG